MEFLQGIFDNLLKLVKTRTEDGWRPKLNKQVHVADIGYQALKSSSPALTVQEHEELVELLTKSLGNVTHYDNLDEIVSKFRSIEGLRPIIVRDLGTIYLVAGTYKTLQTNISSVFKKYAKTHSHISDFIGVDANNKTVVNIGHIANPAIISTTTPAIDKLEDIIVSLPNALRFRVQAEMNKIYKAHNIGVSFNFRRSDIVASKLNRILGSGVILVTVQSTKRNSELATIEAKAVKAVTDYIEFPGFLKKFIKAQGSNSIEQDIQTLILATLKGEKLTSLHNQKKGNVNIKIPAPIVKEILPKVQLRNLRGHFTSLASLQTLLNQALSEQIRKNMGTGNETRILNYRTGRFASSAKVEKMSQSREGMLTAFYTYMKYPYATFSEGGLQQNPRSRDPKLLISKSIREIGASLVKNRMRAVCL